MKTLTSPLYVLILFIMASSASVADWGKTTFLGNPNEMIMLNDSIAIYHVSYDWVFADINNETVLNKITDKFYTFATASQDKNTGDIYVLSDSIFVFSGDDYSLKRTIRITGFENRDKYYEYYFSLDMSKLLKIDEWNIQVLDISTNTLYQKFGNPFDFRHSYTVGIFNSDFRVYGESDSVISVFNPTTGNVEKTIEVDTEFELLSVSPDNKYVVISQNNEAQFIDIDTEEIYKTFPFEINQTPESVKFTSDGKHVLFYVFEDDGKYGLDKFFVYNVETEQKKYDINLDDGFWSMLDKCYLTNDISSLIYPNEYMFDYDMDFYPMYLFYNYDLNKDKIKNILPFGTSGYYEKAIFTSDEKLLYMVGTLKGQDDEQIHNAVVWDAENGEFIERIYFDDIEPMFLSNDDKILYCYDYNYKTNKYNIYLYNLKDKIIVDTLLLEGYKKFEQSPIDNELISVSGNKIYRYDINQKKYKDTVIVMFSDTGDIYNYRFVEENNSLFVANSNFEIKELDILDLSEKNDYTFEHFATSTQIFLDISPEGTHMLAYEKDTNYIFKIYDIKSGNLEYESMIYESKGDYSNYDDIIADFFVNNHSIMVYNIHHDVWHNKQIMLTVNYFKGFELENEKECSLHSISSMYGYFLDFVFSPQKNKYAIINKHSIDVVNTCEPLLTSVEEYADYQENMIYPNPATDYFKFKSEFPVNRVIITDILGRVVFSHDGIIEQINTFGFAKGVFIINYQTINGTNHTDKVIVK